MNKICKSCNKLKKYHAKGLCKPCYDKIYYSKYKKKLNKQNIKNTRNRNLKKRFGFIPKLFLYNKDVTSDGCFYGNSGLVERFNNYKGKMMFLYKCGKWPDEYYKIQIVNCNIQEEFWIRSDKSRKEVNKFFNKLKNYPVDCLRYWEIERIQI